MRVYVCGESVVEVIGDVDHATAKVDGLHHAPGRHDPQHRVEVRVRLDRAHVQAVGQCLARLLVHLETLQDKQIVDDRVSDGWMDERSGTLVAAALSSGSKLDIGGAG